MIISKKQLEGIINNTLACSYRQFIAFCTLYNLKSREMTFEEYIKECKKYIKKSK